MYTIIKKNTENINTCEQLAKECDQGSAKNLHLQLVSAKKARQGIYLHILSNRIYNRDFV